MLIPALYFHVVVRKGYQCKKIVSSHSTNLELGLDVLTGRALRGGGGGIADGASSEK